MTLQALGSRLTDTQTSTDGPKNVLGEIFHHQGKAYKYVKNSSAGAFAVNRLVSYDLTADDGTSVIYPAAAFVRSAAGVTLSAIPASGFGWIQVGGYATCDFDGAGADSVAGAPVTSYDTIGKCQGIDVTVASQVASKCGFAYDASTTDVTLEVFLAGLI